MIEVRGLKIHYGDVVAVNDLSFSVKTGSIFGLIGPNGAGKTTAIKAIATLLEPTLGEILVNEISVLHQPERARKIFGYMPDFPPVYEDLKIWEFCDLFAHAYGIDGEQRKNMVLQSLEDTGLKAHMNAKCRTLSRGMRQRALLAKTLVHAPEVLLLDEPAANLDPKSRIELRNILKKLARDGKTILLSSHVLSEIEDTCDAIGFMKGGKMAISGTIEEVSRQNRQSSLLQIQLSRPDPNLFQIIGEIPVLSEIQAIGSGNTQFRATVNGGEAEATDILAKLVKAGLPVSGFTCERPSVEDIFLEIESQNLVGRKAE
jgi:ABC-2 type transport system ATP-binding protein